MGKFSNFYYFENPKSETETLEVSEVSFLIHEKEFDRLLKEFQQDYKYFLDANEFKDDWGYGYTFKSRDGTVTLLNRWKDEVINEDSKIICCCEDIFKTVKELFKITLKE